MTTIPRDLSIVYFEQRQRGAHRQSLIAYRLTVMRMSIVKTQSLVPLFDCAHIHECDTCRCTDVRIAAWTTIGSMFTSCRCGVRPACISRCTQFSSLYDCSPVLQDKAYQPFRSTPLGFQPILEVATLDVCGAPRKRVNG